MASSLSDHPKLGLNIAEYIGSFNTAEFTLYQALGEMLGDTTGSIAEAILSKIDSAAYKQNVVFDIARLRAPDCKLAKAILAAETVLKRATKLRNELAHGLYGIDEDGQVVLFTNTFSFGKKPFQSRLLERAEILKMSGEFNSAMLAIHRQMSGEGVSLHGGVITNRMRDVHGSEDPGEPA